jgi:sec-independent protein translocase protein TatB
MFDIAPTELLLCAIVALVVIGPKDLPKAMRVLGHWAGRVRGMARHFRSGIDTMIRESELEEMQKKWAEENARIMREHPYVPEADAATEAAEDAQMLPLPTPVPDTPPKADEGERG